MSLRRFARSLFDFFVQGHKKNPVLCNGSLSEGEFRVGEVSDPPFPLHKIGFILTLLTYLRMPQVAMRTYKRFPG